jgi:hypothetical protein
MEQHRKQNGNEDKDEMALTKEKIHRRQFLTAVWLESDRGLSLHEAKELQNILEEERDIADREHDFSASVYTRMLLLALLGNMVFSRR